MLSKFLQKEGKFPLLIALLLAPSGCSVNRAWLQRDVRRGMHVHCKALRCKEMVNRCVAARCSNTPSDHVSLLKIPSDGILRHKWEKQLQQTQAQWKATEHCFFVVTILLRTVLRGRLPWRSGMEESEVVFLVPAATLRPVAGIFRMGW